MGNSATVKRGSETYRLVFKTLIAMSIPTILEEVLSTLIQYVDTAMVGRLGEEATAAVSTTTTINWLIHSVPAAIGVAVLAIAAKAMGAGDEKKLRRVSGQAILLAFSSGIIIEIIAILLSPYIPIWMGAAENIQADATMYFAILSTSLFLRTSSRIFAASIRATKDTKTPMRISLLENLLNVVLNWTFIYGLSMGVKGAAIASAISYAIGGLLMYVAFRRNKNLKCDFQNIKPDREILAETVKIGMPALGTTFVSCMGYVVFAGMVSGMGTTIFAAHSIAVAAEEIVYIPGYGLRMATSSLVGNALGEKDIPKLKITEEISIIITVLIMVINGILLYVFANPLMSVFTKSMNVINLGADMLKMVAFSEPFFGLMIVLEGIEYGLGRTKTVFYIEAFSMWCIRILATFICVKIMHLSLYAVWGCMIADNVCKALLLLLALIKKRQQSLYKES
ncbi:MAG: MATE family efflux transporter [Lachnospiraceae bacterium]|nr:MATE family efflux transporter [Candidatus Colinaster scatohippi]